MVYAVDCDAGVVAGSVTVDVSLLFVSVDCDAGVVSGSVAVGIGVRVEVTSGSVGVVNELVTGLVVGDAEVVTVVD